MFAQHLSTLTPEAVTTEARGYYEQWMPGASNRFELAQEVNRYRRLDQGATFATSML
jgi:hypothetical protein